MSMLGEYASFPERGVVGLFERHGANPRGCIHVGTWDCCEMDCYLRLFGNNVFWVEANHHTYVNVSTPIIRTRAPEQKLYHFAAWDKDNEELELLIPNRADCSSLLPSDGHDPVFIPINREMVKTKTLDTFIQEQNLDMSQIDYLNIDTEGSEYNILEGVKNNLHYIDYLIVEVANRERFKGMVVFNEMEDYLREKGFILVENSDMKDDWGDAFFIRESKL